MPKGAQFSDASYKKTESAKGKKKVARLAYTYAGHEVGSVDIVKTGAKVKDNYYVNTDSGQKKNERVIRIDPAWLIVAGVVIVDDRSHKNYHMPVLPETTEPLLRQ